MADQTDPLPMILTCPACGCRHIDGGIFATKAHHTHACQGCGMVWRPAIFDTVGVQFLPGYRNTEVPAAVTQADRAAVAAIEDMDPDHPQYEALMRGDLDTWTMVQAFHRHRIAAEQACADNLARLQRERDQAVEALRIIKHSMEQAAMPGNDWRREIDLSNNIARAALASIEGAEDEG